MLQGYLERLFDVAKRGDATEESYYSSLEGLLNAYATSAGKKAVHITVLPKKTEAGNPDFRIWDGKQHVIGYIEAKKPTEQNLDQIQSSEQLERYRHTFPNLILTNFLEFRLYRSGALIDTAQIGRPFIIHQLKTVPPVEKEREFLNLLDQFFTFSLPRTYTAKSLAIELAKRTRFLKEQVIAEELREESERGAGFILGFYEAFQKYLIGTLTKDDFADLYAQTITYGLFAARTRAENGFSRKLAFHNIPPTIGILRDVFQFISLGDLPNQMEWIVDDIADVLATADVNRILQQRAGRDPIVHFYEPFLAEYDPAERERRGVYYTPEPVVSYIVRSLHRILKETFARKDGFASTSVRVLDPAAGTCTFPAEATRLAVTEFTQGYGTGAQKSLIKDHILKNFYAFELMMAPYAVGHLKIGFLLNEFGHRLGNDERFQLYLTNTLDMEELQESNIPGMVSLAEESHLAGKVKKETPILVILGNPPYSGHSANAPWKVIKVQRRDRTVSKRVVTFIGQLIEAYKQVDGRPLGEKNPKWLQDDYVKFIRFSQWKIEQAGEGILGLITNHGYLDNPTFRGMRQSLMNSFEQIFLLNLHGNTLKKERCPDGSKDENVFDIRQGVAIGIFIKKSGLQRNVFHADLWGLREEKYRWLGNHDITATEWSELHPKSPLYVFVPWDEALFDHYQRYPKVTEIFPINSVGIVTSRDHFVVDFEKDMLERRIGTFRDRSLPDDMIREAFKLKDNRDWKMSTKREAIITDEDWREAVNQILYKPFDPRWVFYHKDAVDFGRSEVMRHMRQGNLGLIAPKRVEVTGGWQHVLATDLPVEHVAVSAKTIDYLFPLYLQAETGKEDLLGHSGGTAGEKPNLSSSLLSALSEAYSHNATPDEIFSYIYAVLYAPMYRTKYAAFLKTDFPRVPFSRSWDLFNKAGRLGKRLVDLHLVTSPELDPPLARLQPTGSNKVEKHRYSQEERCVHINEEQHFEGIPPEVWEYQIGGYQVLDKWLKDRKGRYLNLDEIKHYCHIVTAIAKTIEVQKEIDALYPEIEKDILSIDIADK